jgi:alkylation response protein AidB-like acyl-CoA dehydrogenase
MELILNDEQRILAGTAAAFAKDSGGVARLRALRDGLSSDPDKRAYDKAMLLKMADVGFTSIAFEERDGGLGLGMASLVIVTEALGRVLAPEPLIPSLALAAQVVAIGGSDALRESVLGPALAGTSVLALAQSERGARYDLSAVALKAERSTDGFVLGGDKLHVWGGYGADGYVVSTRTSGKPRDAKGITLFYVPANATGVSATLESRVDSQNAASVRFANVAVKTANMIGAEGEGLAILERATERATVALCGEMLGGMSEAFERTVAYLKERKQFGVTIGSFQALKHRAAKLYVEIELARSAVMAAARALDEQSEDASALVSLAKARLSDTYSLVVNEAVQMHGGIGMTDEHEIGFFMKRARAAEMTFGDSAYHRDRYARLTGY